MFKTILISIFLSSSAVYADPYFERMRMDHTVPAHCAEPLLKTFSVNPRTLIYGVKGSVQQGFTHSYPISRDDAQYLWLIFLDNKENDPNVVAQVKKKRLEVPFGLLKEAGVKSGFDFSKEGDVLEVLAISDLAKEYPAPKYYITGGIMYHKPQEPNALGELDIVVAEREGCKVVAIGESKLGVKQLNHAKDQLERFKRFLKQVCAQTQSCHR